LKKRPRAPLRMQARAIPTARCVLPEPHHGDVEHHSRTRPHCPAEVGSSVRPFTAHAYAIL
jgi:hypothetical protein